MRVQCCTYYNVLYGLVNLPMVSSSGLSNAQHMRTRVTVVCLCLSVCYQPTDIVRHLYNKMNIPPYLR